MLGVVYLDKLADVNNFEKVEEYNFISSNAFRLYFQLVTVNNQAQGASCHLRYIPPTGAVFTAKLMNIDDSKIISKVATQAFPTTDTSIYYIDILPTDVITPDGIEFSMLSGGVITQTVVVSTIRSLPAGKSKFYC